MDAKIANTRRDVMKRWAISLILCIALAITLAVSATAADEAGIVVGRVYQVEGDLLRYVPDANDWAAVVSDAPFGKGDTLYSGNQGMAELIVPNGSWIRMGYGTQIQFIALDQDVAEMDLASGVGRFYNKGSQTVIKVTSPFGYVLAYPGSTFDFYVGENSVEVIAVQGKVSFIHTTTQAKYDVTAGYPSVLADQQQVSSGEGVVDPSWDQWNRGREEFWVAKARVKGPSVEYLPPSLRDEAYALEENGRWETVVYEGTERRFWRPTTVAQGWAPFTAGRWTDWYGDQTWIPAEPFGYVTHHYGNWVLLNGFWYWAPPVARVRIGLPFLDVGFFWTPGRVSWIHSGEHVGWVPLAPREVYYSHHHWGGRQNVFVTNVTQINVNVRTYAYANHAIIVSQNNFYGVNNYRNVRVTNINQTTIINNFKAAPVVNNTVIKNYTTNKQKFNFTNVVVKEKPHSSVLGRIEQNEKIIRQEKKVDAKLLEQQVKKVPDGKVNRQARIEQPKSTNYIVPANEVNRPKAEIALPKREVKKMDIAPAVQPGIKTTPGSRQPGQQMGQPGQQGQPGTGQPGQPGKPKQPGSQGQPGVIQPPRPGQPGSQQSEQGQTGRQGQPGQQGQIERPPRPGQQPTQQGQQGVIQPPRPGQPSQPGQIGKPKQMEQPGSQGQPGQIERPPRPGQQPMQQGQQGVVQPPRPGQPSQSGQIGKPKQMEQPGSQGQQGQIERPPRPGQQPMQQGQQGVVQPPRPGQPSQPGRPGQMEQQPGQFPQGKQPGQQNQQGPSVQPGQTHQQPRSSQQFGQPGQEQKGPRQTQQPFQPPQQQPPVKQQGSQPPQMGRTGAPVQTEGPKPVPKVQQPPPRPEQKPAPKVEQQPPPKAEQKPQAGVPAKPTRPGQQPGQEDKPK